MSSLGVLARLYLKHTIRLWQGGRRNPLTLLALAWLRAKAEHEDSGGFRRGDGR